MKIFCLVLLVASFTTGCTHRYYVVRHAEKATSVTNPSDPPLSSEGVQRAEALKTQLIGKKIKKIYSTSTQRAMETAQPLSDATGISIEKYGPIPDKDFIQQLRSQKINVLIVAHSNTVDDIVNGLYLKKELQDIPDNEYDNLFIITTKGKKLKLQKTKYGF